MILQYVLYGFRLSMTLANNYSNAFHKYTQPHKFQRKPTISHSESRLSADTAILLQVNHYSRSHSILSQKIYVHTHIHCVSEKTSPFLLLR